MKGPRPTRFTTLSCNYHHKVDFTSSKSPRKGMLHFALAPYPLPATQSRVAPFDDPSGYTTYGKPPWPSFGHSLLHFTLRSVAFPLLSVRRCPSTALRTLKPAVGYLLPLAKPADRENLSKSALERMRNGLGVISSVVCVCDSIEASLRQMIIKCIVVSIILTLQWRIRREKNFK